MTQYPTCLIEKQWQVKKNILELQVWKRKHSYREMMNAIFISTRLAVSGVCFHLISLLDRTSITTSLSGSLKAYFKRWWISCSFSSVNKKDDRKAPSWYHGFQKCNDFLSCWFWPQYRREQENQDTERAHHCQYA